MDYVLDPFAIPGCFRSFERIECPAAHKSCLMNQMLTPRSSIVSLFGATAERDDQEFVWVPQGGWAVDCL